MATYTLRNDTTGEAVNLYRPSGSGDVWSAVLPDGTRVESSHLHGVRWQAEQLGWRVSRKANRRPASGNTVDVGFARVVFAGDGSGRGRILLRGTHY